MIGWIALGMTLVIFASIALRIDDWGRDWSQNVATLDPTAQRVGLRPLVFDAGVDQTTNLIRRWVESNSRWDLVSASEAGQRPARIHLARTTAILRFVDDIEVTIEENPDAGGTVVSATSRSRVGKGDLGQNPRNLIELTSGLQQEAVGGVERL